MSKETNFDRLRNIRLKRRNERMKQNFRNLFHLMDKAGEVPVYYVDDVPEGLELFSLLQAARFTDRTPMTFYNRLKRYGLIRKEGRMWILEKSLQDKTFAAYVIGAQQDYTTLQLRLTRFGVEAVIELLRQMMLTGKPEKK